VAEEHPTKEFAGTAPDRDSEVTAKGKSSEGCAGENVEA
jgi:hypothetical protein